MTNPERAERDRRLLSALIDTLPAGASPEEHQGAVASLLVFFERLHGAHGAELPGWLVLGRKLYLSPPEPETEAT